MAKHTMRDLLVAGLRSYGYEVVGSKSRKYTVLVREGEADRKVFLGKSGAFRVGASASNSVSMTGTRYYEGVLEAGREALTSETRRT